MNSIEKIGRGIDRIEREKAGGNFRLSNLAGAPASIADLNKLAESATRKRDRLKALTAGIIAAVDKHAAETEMRLADVGKQSDENGSVIDTLGQNRRRKMIDEDVKKFRRDVLKISADERLKLLSELREITGKIALVKDGWSDPVAVLMRSTRADPHRATYAQDMSPHCRTDT